MADNIPEGIHGAHILEAFARYDSGFEHQFSDSTIYDVLYRGKRYPPKAIVGIAAEVLTNVSLGPKDFSAGQTSKCFRVLQTNGFQIVTKLGDESKTTWMFQGNPNRFGVDDYLSRYTYIYWRAPRHRAEIRVGDPCVLWRSGQSAGAIAIGRIAEAPQPMADVNFPEYLGEELWRDEVDSSDTIKVGIEIDEVRLDEETGFIPRSVFLDNSTLAESTIIKSPQGTVFRLRDREAKEVFLLWNTPLDCPATALPSAMEGTQRLRQHYARERNRRLTSTKKEEFAKTHGGRVYCEVCHFDFSNYYPPVLADGFIEVHHLVPLFTQEQSKRTTLDDLLLVCSNCHRMIHRTKDVEDNLQVLRNHFTK